MIASVPLWVVLICHAAIGLGGERDIDTVIDEERYVRRQRGLDLLCARDHVPRRAVLVAQLHQGRGGAD